MHSWSILETKEMANFRNATFYIERRLAHNQILTRFLVWSIFCIKFQCAYVCLSVCLSAANLFMQEKFTMLHDKIHNASWQNSQCRRKRTNASWLLPENKRHHWGCWLGDLPRRRLLTTTERVICTSAIVGSSSSSSSSSWNETHDGKRLMRWVREEAKETVLSS